MERLGAYQEKIGRDRDQPFPPVQSILPSEPLDISDNVPLVPSEPPDLRHNPTSR
jgi:hypothetical protein